MGQVGAWIEFYIIVAFDLSNFVWMVRVGYRLEFSVLVFFLVFCVGALLKFAIIILFYFHFRVYRVPFLFFLGSRLSDSSVLESCWGTGLV